MGWGEEHNKPQGDMGLGTLTPSQIITQRGEERQAAKELADAVEEMFEYGVEEWMVPIAEALAKYKATLI